MAANCAPPANTSSDIVNTSAGDRPFVTASAPHSAANGMPATMAGITSASAERHSDVVGVMQTMVAHGRGSVLNEIAIRDRHTPQQRARRYAPGGTPMRALNARL